MLQAFVGIVSREGLEAFCPEHPQTIRFLWRRAQRERGRVACFWCVMPDETAQHVQAAIECGQLAEALLLLQQQAREYGFILPRGDNDVCYVMPAAPNRV